MLLEKLRDIRGTGCMHMRLANSPGAYRPYICFSVDSAIAELEKFQDELEKLQGDLMCAEHVVGVLKHSAALMHAATLDIEKRIRVHDGRVQIHHLDEWIDAETNPEG